MSIPISLEVSDAFPAAPPPLPQLKPCLLFSLSLAGLEEAARNAASTVRVLPVLPLLLLSVLPLLLLPVLPLLWAA